MVDQPKTATIVEHLNDLRRALIVSMVALVIGILVSYVFLRDPLMDIVFGPIRQLGKDTVMIGVAEGFLVQMNLVCIGGAVIASPVIIWQVMWFVLPALYRHEKRVFLVSFVIALMLFAAGIVFGYRFVFEFGLRLFLFDYAQGLNVMISASRYLSFFTWFLLPFGLIFEIPLATFLLSSLGLITAGKLRQVRGYAVLVVFSVAAVLTPPDVLSQVLLALPMLLLYEISILLAVVVEWRRKKKESAG